MPKGRMLNRKISEDGRVGQMSVKAVLIFTWLIPHCDTEGRFSAEPIRIKGHILPFVDDITIEDINNALQEMENIGLITTWEHENRHWLQMTGFHKNQRIDKNREADSHIPQPSDNKKHKKTAKKLVKHYPEWFEDLWRKYPKFPPGKKDETFMIIADKQERAEQYLERYIEKISIDGTDKKYIQSAQNFFASMPDKDEVSPYGRVDLEVK